jgi:hypothetical protein
LKNYSRDLSILIYEFSVALAESEYLRWNWTLTNVGQERLAMWKSRGQIVPKIRIILYIRICYRISPNIESRPLSLFFAGSEMKILIILWRVADRDSPIFRAVAYTTRCQWTKCNNILI